MEIINPNSRYFRKISDLLTFLNQLLYRSVAKSKPHSEISLLNVLR